MAKNQKMKKLPDTEFDVMKVVWGNEPPITSAMVMQQLGNERGWKVQTVISLLLRLVDRGFLKSEKIGKERTYYPLVSRDDYLTFETGNFLRQYYDNSFLNLASTLYEEKAFTQEDIEELLKWVKDRRV